MIDYVPYTNFHELNLDWIVKQVKEYIAKYETLETFVNSSIDSQNALIEKALQEISSGMQDLRENLQTIAQQIINELIETGRLYIGVNYIAETEELNIVLSQGE